MNFKVESGIPFVSNRGGRGRKPTAFPFDGMDVGDSFLIPCDPQDKKVLDSWRRKLRVAKQRYNEALLADANQGGDEIELRTGVEKDGLRVWMTA